MAGSILNFTTQAVADPYTPPAGYSIVGSPSRIFDTGIKYWRTRGTESFCRDDVNTLSGDLITCRVKVGFISDRLCGAALLDSDGNGYTALTSNSVNNIRIFRVNAGVLNTTPLWTSTTFPVSTGDDVALTRNTNTNEYTVFANNVQFFNASGQTFTSATYSPNHAAAHSGTGYVAEMESIFTPSQTIDSINGDSPIEAGQSVVVANHTGFGGAITSITTNHTGLTASIISGDNTSTTFSISGWIDGGEYPLMDSSVTFTFSRSGESAAAVQTVTAPDGYSQVTFSSPDTSDDRKFSKMMVDVGLTVDGSTLYYKTDTIPDLVINPDSSGEPVDNGGTFTAWLRDISDGLMYQWEITINEQGEVVLASHRQLSLGIGIGIGI